MENFGININDVIEFQTDYLLQARSVDLIVVKNGKQL